MSIAWKLTSSMVLNLTWLVEKCNVIYLNCLYLVGLFMSGWVPHTTVGLGQGEMMGAVLVRFAMMGIISMASILYSHMTFIKYMLEIVWCVSLPRSFASALNIRFLCAWRTPTHHVFGWLLPSSTWSSTPPRITSSLIFAKICSLGENALAFWVPTCPWG